MIAENAELDPASAPLCVHCKARRRTRAGGLCHGCYFTPAIRVMYPPTKYLNRYPSLVGQKAPTRVPTPTSARPGSAEKLKVLEQRAASGEQLWHPLDTPGDEESLALGVHLRNG